MPGGKTGLYRDDVFVAIVSGEHAAEISGGMNEVPYLRDALRNMRGDDLCWIDTLGAARALPWKEFQESCRRFHSQIAGRRGIFNRGRTIAQLEQRVAELELGLAAKVSVLHRRLEGWINLDPEFRYMEVLPGRDTRWCVRLNQIYFQEPFERTLGVAEATTFPAALSRALDVAYLLESESARKADAAQC